MIEIKELKFEDVYDQIEELTEQHWNKDWRKSVDSFIINEDIYKALSATGNHKLFVAFDDKGFPVGYCSVFLSPSMHSDGIQASMDALFVDPVLRGRGIAEKLLEVAEAACKDVGCSVMSTTFRNDHVGESKLLLNRGFSLKEIVYAKTL